ncbi:MAG TPA: excinuclease ABC subunit UvrC [Chitinivibrionales bacterium]|nr:excinuclease ABC subunit UvrC [Chitinivibrionales bacterium]
MPEKDLIDSLDRFPESPGVYLMKDAAGVILYIGKAVNLKSRVRSYFLDTHEDRPHIPFMLARLHHVDWIATNTEAEALILEANLIRKHKPKFNIDLKDDKHYPYLKITVNEPFPRLLVVRRAENDGARYFGPYTDARAMRRLVQFAKRIFRIRDCNKELPLKKPARPCVNWGIGRCSGACASKISQEEYRSNVDMVIRFFSGKRKDLIRELQERMELLSSTMHFESAANVRDQIRLIRDASKLQQVDFAAPDLDCDVFGVYKGDRSMCLAALHVREGLLMSARSFAFDRAAFEASGAGVETLLLQFYLDAGQEPPPEVLIHEAAAADPRLVQKALAAQFGAQASVTVPQKGPKADLAAMAVKNARLYLMQKLPPNALDDLADLQALLCLPRFPHVIEAFDISNLGETNAVAGMVRFKDGQPDKSGYRRYKIKTVNGQNDFAMMMEVVGRRINRQKEEGQRFADLYLIDGGLGQLHAAMQPLAGVEKAPMVVALAKQEEIVYSPYCKEPARLAATHPVRKFLERVRDEVHRFAITYHRTLRGHRIGVSALQSVPGMGKKRVVELLRHFGSLKRVKEASVDEIAGVKGIPAKLAMEIKRFLKDIDKQE